MFNDADQLGNFFEKQQGGALFESDAVKTALAKIVIQFAGDLGLQASEKRDDRAGVIGLGRDGDFLQIDLDPDRWKETAKQDKFDIVGLDELNTALIENLKSTASGDTQSALSDALAQWGDSNQDLTLFAAGLKDVSLDINGRSTPTTKDGDPGGVIFAGNKQNDTLVGGDGQDLLIGEDGNDTLVGADGFDILYGGKGNDKLVAAGATNAGDESDVMVGGEGADDFIITYSTGMFDVGAPVFTISDAEASDRLFISQNILSKTD